MDRERVFYGVAQVALHFPNSRSLKDKRSILHSLKGRLAERYKISVVDAGPSDLWQRGILGIAVVGRDEGSVRSILAGIARLIESEDRAVLLSFVTRVGSLDDDPSAEEDQ
ncbi:MAG: DUF503 domain-containing protein [Candidatus Eisenbacteria bacterium]|nr:DUF503 domain-containing protein [Candidatus Eisenbacteria bacterium]